MIRSVRPHPSRGKMERHRPRGTGHAHHPCRDDRGRGRRGSLKARPQHAPERPKEGRRGAHRPPGRPLALVPDLAAGRCGRPGRVLLRPGALALPGVQPDHGPARLVVDPAGVAVAEGYAYSKYRGFGAKVAVAAWAELAAGAIAFSALAGLALGGAVIAGGSARVVLVTVLSVVFAGSVAAAVLFRHPHVLVDIIRWLERHVGRRLGAVVGRVSTRIRDIARALEGVHPSLATWAWAGALSALNWLLDVVCLALGFRAVGAMIPWGAVLLAFAGGKIVSSVGVTPAGLGYVEGGLVAVFVAYGTK